MRLALISLCVLFPVAVSAADISFALTHQPPYMIEETSSGIFTDLISQAFAAAGHRVKLEFLPNRRAFAAFENRKVDGVLYYFGDKAQGSCRTEPYGNYQPMLMALKKNAFKIVSLDDVGGRRVGAFLGARDYFALTVANYAEAVAAADYREEPDLARLTKLLLNDRLDIGIFDWRIFLWTAKTEAEGSLYTVRDIERHPLFPIAWVSAQLWNPAHCEAFNRGLAILRSDGRYVAIHRKYTLDPFDGS